MCRKQIISSRSEKIKGMTKWKKAKNKWLNMIEIMSTAIEDMFKYLMI